MSLREKQMLQRKNHIMNVAEGLIRQTRSTNFSVRKLAAEAGVSQATPFNIFGSKEGLLYSLLIRTLDKFMEQGLVFSKRKRLLHFIEASQVAADILVSDSVFFRPLYQVLMGVTHEQHRPEFMSRTFSYWRTAAESIPPGKRLSSDTNLDLLAHSLMAHFTGLMEMWINYDMDDEEFCTHVTCAAIIDAYSFLTREQQAEVTKILDRNSKKLRIRICAS
jgi:AcrR family transcriptional regulator